MHFVVFYSALHVAARRQDWRIMSCLIRLGANPLQENNTFRNPLQIVALKVCYHSANVFLSVMVYFCLLEFSTSAFYKS